MRKYYVTVKNWHKIRRRPMKVLLATHDLTTRMRSGVIMSFFRPHVHSICMRCINWPSMKWITLHASNYHMGWILVQNCVRPCTRVCVRGMSACMACVHIFASCMYRQYGSGRTSTFFWNQQHVTVINPHKEVTKTPPHVPRGFMNCKRDTV